MRVTHRSVFCCSDTHLKFWLFLFTNPKLTSRCPLCGHLLAKMSALHLVTEDKEATRSQLKVGGC